MENENIMTAVSDTVVENTKPKHKWLAKGSDVYHTGFCRYR